MNRQDKVDDFLLHAGRSQEIKANRQEWMIYRYRTTPFVCPCCKEQGRLYFEIKNVVTSTIANQVSIQLCDGCTSLIPNLTMSANEVKFRFDKIYTIVGTFKQRRFEKNNFTLNKRSKLKVARNARKMERKNENGDFYRLLEDLQEMGFKVPIFGEKYDYVAVNDPTLTYVEGQEYLLRVKIRDWENVETGQSGYEVYLVV